MPRARGTLYVADTDPDGGAVVEGFHAVAVHDDGRGAPVVVLTDPVTGLPSELALAGRRFRVRLVLEPAQPLPIAPPLTATG